MIQFGSKEPSTAYAERPAAYAIIIDRQSKIAAIKHKGKFYLPGGGIEGNETLEQTLTRELLEETGWTVKIIRSLAKAGEYVFAGDEKTYINRIGHFFLAEIIGADIPPVDDDHEAIWISLEELRAGVAHGSHYWAAQLAVHSGGIP